MISCIRNGPLQNKFYLADRDRERSRLMIGFKPDAPISVQARVDVNRDRYPNSPYGVTDASSWSAGADLGYVFGDDFSATLFYTFEDQRSRERSRQIDSANPAAASSAASDWVNQLVDKTSSIGFGMKYKGLLGGRLELNADAIAVRGRTPISTTVVSAVQNPATALPDLTVRSANINFAARYAVDRHSTIRLNYFYRWLKSTDWAYQQVDVATLANAIGTNEMPPTILCTGSVSHTFARFGRQSGLRAPCAVGHDRPPRGRLRTGFANPARLAPARFSLIRLAGRGESDGEFFIRIGNQLGRCPGARLTLDHRREL